MKPNEVSSSEKNSSKRQTSSTQLLGEIPVFSDTDDEEEYTKQFLNDYNLTVLPSTSKNRDVEVQCDIPMESDIMNLIKVCSILNINEHSDLVELISICKVLSEKYYRNNSKCESSNITRGDNLSTQVLDDQVPLNVEAMPERQPDIYATIVRQKSVTASQDSSPSRLECFNLTNKSTINKRNLSAKKNCNTQSKTKLSQGDRKKNFQNDIPRRSARLKLSRKWDKNFGKVIGDKKEILQKNKIKLEDENVFKKKASTEIEKDSIFKIPKQKAKKLQQKAQGPTFQNVFETLDSGTKELVRKSELTEDQNMYKNYSPRTIKRLARSWINPNKSLDNELMVHTDHKITPIYTSLQHAHKLRRLYSPTEWLASEVFEQSCPSFTNPIRTIFKE